MNIEVANRFRNSFYSGVWGDILGANFEFKDRSQIPPNLSIAEILDIPTNVFGIPNGTYTDDTALMLCAMSSFIESNTFHHDNQMEWLGEWIEGSRFSRTGRCFDVGTSTYTSYEEWKDNAPDDGSKNERLGNGVLMRMAPFAYWSIVRECNGEVLAKQVTDLTHGSECYDTSVHMLYDLKTLYKYGTKTGVKTTLPYNSVNGYHRDSWSIAKNSVVFGDLEKTILNAISYGGDTDTHACIAAQICGDQHVLGKIRFSKIWGLNQIEDILEKFIETANKG